MKYPDSETDSGLCQQTTCRLFGVLKAELVIEHQRRRMSALSLEPIQFECILKSKDWKSKTENFQSDW